MRANQTMPPRGERPGRAGFTYVALLLFLAIATASALAFVSQVGLAAAAKTSHRQALQAEYLARAAANHALYLLLSDPSFPKTETDYYLHDGVTGRYGYRVRRHTDTTFATIATIGIVEDLTVRHSYVVYVRPGGGP